jgi:hypothetical protein
LTCRTLTYCGSTLTYGAGLILRINEDFGPIDSFAWTWYFCTVLRAVTGKNEKRTNNCGHTQHPSGPEGWQLGSHVISSVYLQPARYFPDSIGFSGEVWRQSTARLPR